MKKPPVRLVVRRDTIRFLSVGGVAVVVSAGDGSLHVAAQAAVAPQSASPELCVKP